MNWNSWPAFVTQQLGYADVLAVTQLKWLYVHEYGMVFYLGEWVMRQHSPDMPLRIFAWPLVAMRHASSLSMDDAAMYIDGIPFTELLREGDYMEFIDRYLVMEMRGVRGHTIYERYAAIGGDLTFIWGQLWILRCLPGYPAPLPNKCAKGIMDSDDEDPDGDREQGPPSWREG